MRVGVILVERERLAKTVGRFLVAVEHLQGAAAVVPGAHVVRRSSERAVEGGDRLLVATEIKKRVAGVIERDRMTGRQCQAGVEIGECGFRVPERCLRAAATEQGIDVTRIWPGRLPKNRGG